MNRAAASPGPFMANGRDRHLAGSGRLLGGRGGRDRPDDACGLVSHKGTCGGPPRLLPPCSGRSAAVVAPNLLDCSGSLSFTSTVLAFLGAISPFTWSRL